MKRVIYFIVAIVLAVCAVPVVQIFTKDSFNDMYDFATQERLKRQKAYRDSVSERSMLLLATELYTGNIKEMTYNAMPENKTNNWTLVARYPYDKTGQEQTEIGTTAALWVNNIDKTVYTFSIAGTDEILDTIQYLPMELNRDKSAQQQEVHEMISGIGEDIAKHKQTLNLGDVKKLYITGHSLGGYLAMSLLTDLIDSSIAEQNNTKTYALTKVSDISSTLDINNVFAYTFAAPGLITSITDELYDFLTKLFITIQIAVEIVDYQLLAQFIKPFTIASLEHLVDALINLDKDELIDYFKNVFVSDIPDWSKEKIANNNLKAYDNNLFQYTNTRDVVPNLKLWFSSFLESVNIESPDTWFLHLGKEYQTTSKELNEEQKQEYVDFFKIFTQPLSITILEGLSLLLGLNYHMPVAYLEQLTLNAFQLIN